MVKIAPNKVILHFLTLTAYFLYILAQTISTKYSYLKTGNSTSLTHNSNVEMSLLIHTRLVLRKTMRQKRDNESLGLSLAVAARRTKTRSASLQESSQSAAAPFHNISSFSFLFCARASGARCVCSTARDSKFVRHAGVMLGSCPLPFAGRATAGIGCLFQRYAAGLFCSFLSLYAKRCVRLFCIALAFCWSVRVAISSKGRLCSAVSNLVFGLFRWLPGIMTWDVVWYCTRLI